MKEDLPYFSHDNDARNHAKMKALRARFGWTGYGQFWALNEMIAGSAQARLDLSRKVVRAGAACELGMTTDALESFLAFLADADECGLINYENGVVTTDRTQEDYQKTESGRERKRVMGKHSAEKRQNSAEDCQNSTEESNRIEENRIEEKREEEIREDARAREDFSPSFPDPEKDDEDDPFAEPSPVHRLESALATWNADKSLPRYRFLPISMPQEARGAALRTLGAYTDAEVKTAIANYSKILANPSAWEAFPRYTGFQGFMASGVERYCDEARPFERMKVKPKAGEYIDPERDEKARLAEQRARDFLRDDDGEEEIQVDTQAIVKGIAGWKKGKVAV
jgi:hypothetical protein